MKPYFVARFSDETNIIQDPENDVSSLDICKSKYWDVMTKMESCKLHYFEIHTSFEIWRVDLFIGIFSYNAGNGFREFKCEASLAPLHVDGPFELVYYRDNTVSLNASTGESDLNTKYRIGWKVRKFIQTIVVGD